MPSNASPTHAPNPARFRDQATRNHGLNRELGGAAEVYGRPRPRVGSRTWWHGLASELAAMSPVHRGRLPFVPQVAMTDCAPACLAMTLAHHGIDASLATLKKELGAGRDGVSARRVLEVARAHGLSGRGVRTTIGGLRHLPAGTILFWDFGHFVVLEKVALGHVHIIDPANGRRRLPLHEVGESFTGVALEFRPPLRVPARRKPVGQSAPWHYLKLFLPPCRPWPPLIAASVLLLGFTLVMPLAMRHVADVATGGATVGLPVLVAAIAGLLALFVVLQTVRGFAITALQGIAERDTTQGLLNHLLSLPYQYFTARSTGDLAERVRTSTRIRAVISASALSALFDGLLIVSYVGILLWTSVSLALLVLGLALLQVGILVLGWRRQEYLAADAVEAQARATSDLVELLDGIPTIKSTGSERESAARWSHTFAREISTGTRRRRGEAVISSLLGAVQFGAPLVVLLVGYHRVVTGETDLGTVLWYTSLAMGMFVPLSTFVQAALQLSGLGATLRRMSDILDSEPERRGHAVAAADGALEVRGLSFGFTAHGPKVLRNIDLTVLPGSFTVVLGASGSGKSALAATLAKLYEPTGGAVLLDGVDLRTVDGAALRRTIGFVNQDARLFAGSVRDNIALAAPGATDADVVAAATLACVHDDIAATPMGYQTLLSRGGNGLSGGQQQRIALARALLGGPRLLVLDEATSALDPIVEERIMRNLLGLDCTLVVIAHRPSLAELADQIVVLDGGRVVRRGTYAEVMAAGPPYDRLVAR